MKKEVFSTPVSTNREKHMNRCCHHLTLGLAISLITAAQVHAEEHFALEEMIVTAQKRVETQQEITASFNVYSGDAIEKSQWEDISDVAELMPSLEVVGVTKTRTSVYIRSIGTNKSDIGTEGSVGVFVDGVYVPRFSSVMQNLVDLDRVEILKGPQGTLYGRNTIGGAISLYTKDPNEDFAGTFSLEAGNENSYFTSLSASGAIIDDKLLGYVAVAKRESGGFRTEIRSGAEDDESVLTGRTKLIYTPTDILSLRYTYDYSDQSVDAFTGEIVIPEGSSEIFAISPPTLPPYISIAEIDAEIAKEASDPYSSEADLPGYTEVKSYAQSLLLKVEHDNYLVESTLGRRKERTNEAVDDDRTRFDVFSVTTEQESVTTSYELKISSEEGGELTFDDKIAWLGGIFLYNDDASRTDYAELGEDSVIHGYIELLRSFPPGGFPFGAPPEFQIPTGSDLVVNGAPYPLEWTIDLETKSWAIFGEMTYTPIDELSFTFGLRQSYDTKEFTYIETAPGNETNVLFIQDNFSFDDEIEFDSLDPKLVVDWTPEFLSDVMFYYSITQGYKSGGIQFLARREDIARQSFDKEVVLSQELGIKSRWMDQKLQLNAATYHYDYEDLQIQQIAWVTSADGSSNVMTITDNAGESVVDGFEAELQYMATADWFLQFSYNYMNSMFEVFESLGGEDYTGNVLPASPEHSAWISSDYTYGFKNDWLLGFRVDYSWRSEQAFDAQNKFFEPSYSLINVAFNLTSPEEDLQLKLFCSNCRDTYYRSSVLPLTTDTGWGATGDRRRIGLGMKYSF